jgi:Thiamine biosynthesis ATP pyrophosphatase
LNIIRQIAVRNGYSTALINKLFNKIRQRHLIKSMTSLKTNRESLTYFNLPYIANISERIKHIFKKSDINISFKVSNNLKTLTYPTLDKIHKLDKNGVYMLTCSCTCFYIGRTFRTVSKRTKEHIKCITNSQKKVGALVTNNSAFASHVLLSGHHIDLKNPDIKILHTNKQQSVIDNLETLEILRAVKNSSDKLLNEFTSFDTLLLQHLI